MEKLMHYIWQHRLWLSEDMRTVDGRRITVLDTGKYNTDAGPDFFNAKIKLDGQLWAGDVEIHVRASDWFRHGHDSDAAYDSVILHVVGKDDMPVPRSNGSVIPQFRMPCAPDFNRSYTALVDVSHMSLPCAKALKEMPSVHLYSWIDALGYERMYGKSERILEYMNRFSGDWESACYVALARALGFSVNSEPFERLAFSIPISYLRKHSDSSLTLEAFFFGQAGLLPASDEGNPYVTLLLREYSFLASKFSLKPPVSLGWKMSRMRPQNFPHRRIAYLAAMFLGGFKVMSRLLDATTVEDVTKIFNIELMGYWTNHYTFHGHSGTTQTIALSRASIASLIINVAVPLLHAYGSFINDTSLADRAVSWLQSLKPENNSVVEIFRSHGIECPNAFTSQALIQLRRNYCECHKCLFCRIGHRHLSSCAKCR